MLSPTGHDPDAPATAGTRRRRGVALAAAATVVGVAVLGLAGSAGAASVSAIAFAGPTSCGRLAARFGGGPYEEIRFSTLPAIGGTKTGSRAGVTVSVHRLSPTTLSWQASDGIDLVFVNAGKAPTGSDAVYRYDPEATADTGLRGTNPSDILDHVVVCFDHTPAPTTPTAATTQPELVTTTTEMVPIVSCANPPACQIARPTTTAAIVQQVVTTTAPTTAVPRLPETGSDHDRLAVLGTVLVTVGLAALVLAGRRRGAASDD